MDKIKRDKYVRLDAFTMTVQEVIEELEQFDPDMPVFRAKYDPHRGTTELNTIGEGTFKKDMVGVYEEDRDDYSEREYVAYG